MFRSDNDRLLRPRSRAGPHAWLHDLYGRTLCRHRHNEPSGVRVGASGLSHGRPAASTQWARHESSSAANEARWTACNGDSIATTTGLANCHTLPCPDGGDHSRSSQSLWARPPNRSHVVVCGPTGNGLTAADSPTQTGNHSSGGSSDCCRDDVLWGLSAQCGKRNTEPDGHSASAFSIADLLSPRGLRTCNSCPAVCD